MGRYLGKCKGVVGEIAVLGVRTRARAALPMAATTAISAASSSPRKKIRSSYKLYQLRSRRRKFPAPENSTERETASSEVANCSSSEISSSDFPPSCCSSNNNAMSSCDVVKDRLELVADPEVESGETSSRHFDFRGAARGAADQSDELDSPAPKLSDSKSTVQIKMPSDSEIEEFFAAAEKDLQKRFSDKYNFDIVKDVPLEGRYEWVPIKP